MDLLGSALNKVRPRRKSIGTIIPTLQVIPDNDQVQNFVAENPEDETRLMLVHKQRKRRGSCPASPKVGLEIAFSICVLPYISG
jgi:hypothetical protein